MPGSMVHHGFLSAYRSVASNVTATIKRLARRFPTYKMVFTGHSLGGAESVLCAVDMLDQMPAIRNRTFVYTYGMPRVGNDAWADGIDHLQLPIYRMVYENDLVPHIPFQWLGYQHFAQEVWIHRNKTHFCGKEQESLACSAGTAISDLNIQDHSGYTSGLWEFALLSS
ncbi:hypothetical protein LPJ56_001250 [Coemansia sp. RSA 2599]|nr:hypothetical protein LPJ75_000828 [Coemansia sp. RSA 2598]KAJ1828202.1 hypothetical protein LPJ56_001250 [Coemansia sp. RSA 2599]